MWSPEAGPVVTARWLARFRWAVAAGAALTLAIAQTLGVQFSAGGVLLLLAAQVASNLWLGLWLRRGSEPSDRQLGGLILFDIVILTALMGLTGGPSNPFTISYLVYITLAAVTLNASWAWAAAATSMAGYGALFITPLRAMVDPHAGHDAMSAGLSHQVGMGVAFVAAALLTASFVTRIRLALEDRERALADARRTAAQQERLASLTTLAAGAAHELATPLSVIAVAARELDLAASAANVPAEIAEDARLIRSQVDRCREILDQMSGRADASVAHEAQTLAAARVVAATLDTFGPRDRERVRLTMDPGVPASEGAARGRGPRAAHAGQERARSVAGRGRRSPPGGTGAGAGPLPGGRPRHGHDGDHPAACGRAVLHDQAGGRGVRPRPLPGAHVRGTVGRPSDAHVVARVRHDGDPRLPLRLAGEGRLRDDVARAAETHETSSGSAGCSGTSKWRFLESCDLGLVPSVWAEPGGPTFTMAEWLAAGRPVLVSNRGGLGEVAGVYPGSIPHRADCRLDRRIRSPRFATRSLGGAGRGRAARSEGLGSRGVGGEVRGDLRIDGASGRAAQAARRARPAPGQFAQRRPPRSVHALARPTACGDPRRSADCQASRRSNHAPDRAEGSAARVTASSAAAPTSVERNGVPTAIASSSGKPYPSYRLGQTRHSAFA